MQRHFALRSRVQVDLHFPQRYFWQELQDPTVAILEVPIEFKTLTCSESDLDDELNALDIQHHSQLIPLDQVYPFRLMCVTWPQGLTHLQLIASHVACDGVSMFLFFGDLFRYYAALASGETPPIDPLPYLADWKTLFGIFLNPLERRTAQNPIATQYRLQKSRYGKHYFDKRDWEDLLLRAESLKVKKQTVSSSREQSFNPLVIFPRLLPEAELADVDPHTEPLTFRCFEFDEDQSNRLRRFAKQFDASLYEVLNLAYLKCQIDLAKQEGQFFRVIHLLHTVNIRSISKDPMTQYVLGNFISFQNRKISYAGKDEGLPLLLQKIRLQGRPEDIMPNILKGILYKTALQEAVKGEDWQPFLSLFLNQTQQYFRNATSLMTTNIGVIDRYVRPGKLNVLSVRMLPLTRRYYMGMFIFKKRLVLTASYIPKLLVADEVDEVWNRTKDYLFAFSNSLIR